jgi:hypothetical protein
MISASAAGKVDALVGVTLSLRAPMGIRSLWLLSRLGLQKDLGQSHLFIPPKNVPFAHSSIGSEDGSSVITIVGGGTLAPVKPPHYLEAGACVIIDYD